MQDGYAPDCAEVQLDAGDGSIGRVGQLQNREMKQATYDYCKCRVDNNSTGSQICRSLYRKVPRSLRILTTHKRERLEFQLSEWRA